MTTEAHPTPALAENLRRNLALDAGMPADHIIRDVSSSTHGDVILTIGDLRALQSDLDAARERVRELEASLASDAKVFDKIATELARLGLADTAASLRERSGIIARALLASPTSTEERDNG